MRMLFCLLVASCLIVPAQGLAGDWTQFRGPNNSGLADSSQVPSEWDGKKNIQWKVTVPGVAWSCPIVLGDKIFLTTAITEKQSKPNPSTGGGGGRGRGGFGGGGGGGGRGEGYGDGEGGGGPDRKSADGKAGEGPRTGEPGREGGGRGGARRGGGGGMGGGRGRGSRPAPDVTYRWEVHCLDRTTGNTLWKKVALEKKPTIPTHSTNSFASETPVTDGERLYVYFGMHGLFCYDLKGNELWKKDLGTFPMKNGWGTGSSPALDGDRLFIQCDNEKESFLVAVDKHKGDILWKEKRDARSTWSTPFVWKTKGRTEIVTCGGDQVRSYNPADGKILWELGGLLGTCSATPVADDEMLYVGCGGMGSNSPLFAVKAGATGDITLKGEEMKSAHVAWSRLKAGPGVSSPLLYQGLLYILEQRGGMVSCYDAKTGEPAYYRKRIQEAKGFTSSPWAADGKIFCLDAGGQTFVLKAGPEFTVLGQNKLDEEMCWSTPALTSDAVLLRGIDHLYCIKK